MLIVSPTRELAQQTAETFEQLASHMGGIHARAMTGGTSVRDDVDALRSASVQVASTTPGRLLHLANSGAMDLSHVRVVVLDEGDVMLEGGFADDVRVLFGLLPPTVQALLVSATITPNLMAVSRKLLRDPIQVRLAEHRISVGSIRHYFVDCGSDAAKVDVLLDLYECISVAQTIIFVNRRDVAERLAHVLDENAFTVSVMHGEMVGRVWGEIGLAHAIHTTHARDSLSSYCIPFTPPPPTGAGRAHGDAEQLPRGHEPHSAGDGHCGARH